MKVLVVDVCGTHFGGLGNGVGAITIIGVTLSEAQPRVVVLEPLVARRNIPWFLGGSADLRPSTMVSVYMGRSSAYQAPHQVARAPMNLNCRNE